VVPRRGSQGLADGAPRDRVPSSPPGKELEAIMFETEGLVADLRKAVQDPSPQLAVREVVARAAQGPISRVPPTRRFLPEPKSA
jgi:hypothetical protein